MDDAWKLIVALISAVLLAYLRCTDPGRAKAKKKKKIAALKSKALKLEKIRDQLLAEHATDHHTHQLGNVINSLARLRKQIRQLEQAD